MNLSRIDASGTKIFDRKKNKRVDFQKKNPVILKLEYFLELSIYMHNYDNWFNIILF